MRVEMTDPDRTSVSAKAPLWWPPRKIAGRYLAPFLDSLGQTSPGPSEMWDLGQAANGGQSEAETDHAESMRLSLTAAEASAHSHEYATAVRWLDVAERLNLTLPPAYAEKRERWRALAHR